MSRGVQTRLVIPLEILEWLGDAVLSSDGTNRPVGRHSRSSGIRQSLQSIGDLVKLYHAMALIPRLRQ
jgi:hypothetical protein